MAPRQQNRSSRTRRWACAAMLVMYIAGISGVPLGALPGDVKAGCRCGESAKASGTCCCSKMAAAQSSTTSRSCCAKKPVAAATASRSCCQKPVAANVKSDCSQQEHRAVISLCSCDPVGDWGVLLNLDPRVTTASSNVPRSFDWDAFSPAQALSFESCALSLELPPPRPEIV